MRTPTSRSAALLGALALAPVLGIGGCERLVEREIERTLTRVDTSILESQDLHVVLCGTGSPIADASRAAACTAIVAGGELLLVDVGPGAWEQVDLANLPIGRLSGVLLTHFHSDHLGDLGEAITQSWIAGRTEPLDVHGPPGVARIVDGLREVYARDVDYRVTHHGDDYLPRAAAGAVARETALGDARDADAVVLERNGLRVTMFRVDHEPVSPAVGYRFDYHGRSVVVSGDTRKSASLAAHAKGADILVHEALQPSMTGRAVATATRLGSNRVAKLAGDIPDYHTTPREAAEVARDAGVAHLVLTHLVPAPPNRIARRLFLEGVADVYTGEVTLGEDGMRFVLSAR
jgi:ribonuclease Z